MVHGDLQKKKAKKNVRTGYVNVNATFNNTIITFTDDKGDTVCWETAGSVGYKGSRKATPFAAQLAMERAAEKAAKFVKDVEVRVRGLVLVVKRCSR